MTDNKIIQEEIQPSPKALRKMAEVMAQMLKLGWSKEDLPELEKIFWMVRDKRTGEVIRKS